MRCISGYFGRVKDFISGNVLDCTESVTKRLQATAITFVSVLRMEDDEENVNYEFKEMGEAFYTDEFEWGLFRNVTINLWDQILGWASGWLE